MAAITLDIAGNTRQLDRDIQKTVNKVYSINLKTKGDQPLGRITGKVDEFTKSLDASNARVIAFGASAGIIYGVERAFTALVSTTIEVQKSLQDINVILNVSQAELQKFGDSLFSIARNTGQSFKEVASAATEFSRQGLGVEETLKRTNEALILSRLSGLDTAKSVETLTAAVNSFASQAVTATEIVNKFATVDAAFAVSSADLADAISRVGSSAAQSGVSLNELIAIVTSAQQTTARGGAVIGNSFKTIFTRLQREKVVDLLESLGISSTDSSGQLKSTIQLLTDLGRVYDTLGSQQQAYVAEQVGGVFQINILKAALADLGKEYSIYGSALNVAAGATDQAIRRNEELNKTYAAQINALQENARQLAAAGGERLLGPSIDRLVGGTNTLLSGFNESDGQNFGTTLGKGIIDGLGQFIAGPGLALIGGVLLKLFRDLTKFATGSVQQLLGLNNAATQQQALQSSIQQILTKNPQLLELALKGQQGLNTAANTLLASLQKQTVELQKQAQVAAQISKAFVAQAGVRVSGGIPITPIPTKGGKVGKAAGYIPNFASDKTVEKYTAIALGASPNVRPHMSKGTIGGKKFVMNNQEVEFPGVGSNGDSMVLPLYGDGPRIAAKGFIPNFNQKANQEIKNVGNIPLEKYISKASSAYGVLFSQGVSGLTSYSQSITDIPQFKGKGIGGSFSVSLPSESIYPPDKKEIEQSERFFNKDIDEALSSGLQNLSSRIRSAIESQGKGSFKGTEQIVKGSDLPPGAKGSVFETAVKAATRNMSVTAKNEDNQSFDFDPIGAYPLLQKLFSIKTSGAVEAKIGRGAASNIPGKVIKKNTGILSNIFKDLGLDQKDAKQKPKTTEKAKQVVASKSYKFTQEELARINALSKPGSVSSRAAGYIPNFSAIQDGIDREVAAGIPKDKIYLAQEKALKEANPLGLGVFNKIQEPNKKSRKEAIRSKGFAKGYVPNFAIEDPDTQAASTEMAIGTLTAQLSGLAFAFAFSKDEVKSAMRDLAKSAKDGAKEQRNAIAQEIRERKKAIEAEKRATAGIGPLTRDQQSKITKESAREAKLNSASQIAAADKAAKPGLLGKAGAFAGANALGLSVAAPILGETIKNLLGNETKEARQGGAIASGLGQVGSFAATGAMVGGPVGAAVGVAVGSLLAVPDVVGAFVSDVPELTKAANSAAQDLTRFQDAGSKYFAALEKLEAAIVSEGKDSEIASKARGEYIAALSGLSVSEQKALTTAEKLGNAQEAYAKILEEKIAQDRGAKAALEVGQEVGGKAESQAFTKYFGFIGRNIGRAGKFLNENLGPLGDEEGVARNEALIDYWSPVSTFSDQTSASAKRLETAFLDLAVSGKTGSEAISKIDEIQKQFIGSGKIGGAETADDLKSLLQQALGTDTAGARELTEQLVKDVKENTIGAEDQKSAVQSIISILRLGLSGAREKNVQAVESEASGRAERESRAQALKEEQIAISATVAAIQKNIAIQNLWRSSLENLNENLRGFFNNLKIEQELTQPKNILQDLIGSDADPTRKLALQEGVATINESQRSASATSGINFKQSVRGILEKPFQENLDKITGNLNAQQFSGTEKDIRAESQNVQNKSLEQFGLLNQTMKTVEGLMSEFVAGQISTEQLLEQSKAALSGVGIDVSRGTQASNDIEKAVAELEISSIQEQVKAFQQRVKLANETKQAILQSKINQALGVFGGFEGFLGRTDEKGPDTPETYIERIDPELKKIEKIRSSSEFRYNNPESIDERSKKTPELGRSFAKVYGELITQSGGAFREFIQETLKQRQVTEGGAINYRLRDGQDYTGSGAVGQLGGYDDIVMGLQQDIENQLKLAEDKIKTTSDPVLKRDLQGFVDSIRKLPGGTEGIAQLQANKGLGVARQSDFEKVYNKYDNASLEKLKELSPELASSLAEAVTFGDPLLAETQVQSGIQTKILDVINKAVTESGIDTGIVPEEMKRMLETGTTATTPGTGATASTTTSSQTYPGTPSNGPQAYPNAKTIPTKTISQIEAETTEARDRARSMGLSLNEYRQQYPKGAPQIGPQPSPDFQKYL